MNQKDEIIKVSDFEIRLNHFARFALQRLQGSIYFHDQVKDGNLFASENILELTGYSQEEIMSMEGGFKSIIHPDDLDEVNRMNREVANLKDGEFSEATYRTRKKDGAWIWHRSEAVSYTHLTLPTIYSV